MPHIHLVTTIHAPPERCFDLVLDVDTQVGLGRDMRAVGGVRSGRLHLGDTVTWRARHFLLPWRMTSKIVEVDRPHCFMDEMQRGPFAHWRHVHQFQSTDGGTVMHDRVEYEVPLGILGTLFDAVVLHRYLTSLLRRRNSRLRRLAEGADPTRRTAT